LKINAAGTVKNAVSCRYFYDTNINKGSVIRKVAKKFDQKAGHKEFVDHAHWNIAEPGWEEVAGYVST